MKSFKDYLRENIYGEDESDIEELNHFMLLALVNPEIRPNLHGILHQIAGQDDSGKMMHLLRKIDIDSLGQKAKELLKTEEEPKGEKKKKIEIIAPPLADQGTGEEV